MGKNESLPITMEKRRPTSRYSPPYSATKKRNNCCKECCCWCIIFIIMFTLLLVFVGCILFLVFRPRLPNFHFTSIQFKKLNVSNSASGPILDSQTQVEVEVINLNSWLKMKYGETKVSMTSMEGTHLGEATIYGFVQERNNVHSLKINLKSKVILSNKQAMELKGSHTNDGLKINMSINTGVGTGYGSWTTRTPPVDVNCESIKLKQVDHGITPKCKVKILKWFNARGI